MKLLRFSRPLALRAVGMNLLVVVGAFGLALTPPALVALVFGERRLAVTFAALAVVCAPLLLMRRRTRELELGVRETTLVTALAFPLCAVIAAVPFLGDSSPVDALFEALSGLTTTGLSVLVAERLPTSLLFFRSYCQWLGGAGILLLSVLVVLPSSRAAIELYSGELFGGEHGDRERPIASRGRLARIVLGVYVALTLVASITFRLLGVPAFEAVVVAFSTLSTGGFSMFADSIGAYSSIGVRIGVLAFMLVGAISFPLFHRARHGLARSLRDPQLVTLLVLLAGSAVLTELSRFTPGSGVETLFGAASAVTTTGFDLGDAAAPIEGLIPIALMIVGGAGGSTAGGIKLWRLVLLVRCCAYLVRRALLPKEAVIPVRYGELDIEERELVGLLGFVSLYGFALLGGGLALSLSGFSAEDSLFESASALGTVGLSSGITSSKLALTPKLVLMLQMWAGRVEILPVLLVLTPFTWKRARSRSESDRARSRDHHQQEEGA